ncbi:hypothetical protein AQUCO_04200113v1 [Aquilegia coerulea]|uniref:F-box domain-containing protein n=1 Tax=Aquilegia coerulea TaxID=218851 RepID=A0A2G5CPB6_AQUCA|nr:hypothetical protein AQUCO_04200113v1 [Aquilegia coerulea]
MIKRRKTTKKQLRNWLDLPEDVMNLIFMKLGATGILLHAQYVCSSWRKLAKEPHLYGSIVIQEELWDYFKVYEHFENFVKKAVDRSCGELLNFSSDRPIKPDLMYYVSRKSCSLKYLRLGPQTHISFEGLKVVIIRLPFLEELDVWLDDMYHSRKLIKQLGRSCSKLNCLRLNYSDLQSECDREASAIAKYLPQLLRLQLTGCMVTNSGLQAILDGCTHIEYLDCRNCFNLGLDEDLLKRCTSRIKNLWLPARIGVL